jgi:hypothetical protein
VELAGAVDVIVEHGRRPSASRRLARKSGMQPMPRPASTAPPNASMLLQTSRLRIASSGAPDGMASGQSWTLPLLGKRKRMAAWPARSAGVFGVPCASR